MDISVQQRDLALERNPTLDVDDLLVRDFTQPSAAAGLEQRAQLVYCQAVLMHIHGRDRHRTMLRNMWATSGRYVLIRENWLRHDFVADVSVLSVPYRVEYDGVNGILLDKEASQRRDVWASDRQIRFSA